MSRFTPGRFCLRRARGVALGWLAALAAGSAWAAEFDAQPLAARSGPPGPTLFATLEPAATGIAVANPYDDPRMWAERYHEFDIGAIGTGVAIGDYDGDGRPDVFVGSKTQSGRLFRNLGQWKFEDVTTRAGVEDTGAAAGIWKQGVTWTDVNNDGRLDLYICRFDAPNLLYVNQGDGTFREQAAAYGLDVRDASSMATFYDYDRDGWLDVFVQTNLLNNAGHPGGQRDYLFHNDRNGHFTDVTERAGISLGETQGNSATWWDFDNDGWPDLYVANDFAVPDALYRNNRDGTFTNVIDEVVPHMTYSSMGSDIGDVNNDGRLDLMVADMAATNHQKDQRSMAETRGRTRDPRDGSTAVPNYLHNTLYLNTGVGRVQEAAYLAGLDATDWTWTVRFEDLDNDGRVDLYITNGMYREIHNLDLIGRMMGAESTQERVRAARSSPVLAENNLAFRNEGDLRFAGVGPEWGLDRKGVTFGAALGDLDGDGDLDIVQANFQAGPNVLRNDSDRGHRLVVALRGTASNRLGIGAQVRVWTAGGEQVRQVGLARGYMSSGEPIAHFGLGEAGEIERLEVRWPSGRVQRLSHVAADQRLLITEPDAGDAKESLPPAPRPWFREAGPEANLAWTQREEVVDEIAQQRLLPMRFNRGGPAVAVADITGDGIDDVVLGGTTRDPARLLLGTPTGKFVAAGNLGVAAAVNDGPVLIFDANGDGRNDVLVTRGGNSLPAGSAEYQPVLYLNSGSGLAPAPAGALPLLPFSVGAAVAADFDHDGRLDIFVGSRVVPGMYPLAPRSALLANRGGRFEDVTETVAPALREAGLVTSALWSDVDGDGWADLLVALEWGPVRYFHNAQGRSFEDWTERSGFASAGTGWWSSIASADFNHDGRPDYAIGNVGLNTPYHADAAHPALLYYGEFTEGGTPLPIEAYYEGEKIYPRRSRRELGAVIPGVLQRFQRNDYYARATLEEILGREPLAAARRFAATELRSGILLSQPDGFRFQPLPRPAQIAPANGMVAGDFDGDGHCDLMVVQNNFSPDPVVGRFDGGLGQLLRGDGQGGFEAVPVASSGLVVPGDAKALALVQRGGAARPEVLVTRNNAASLLFTPAEPNAGGQLRVTLRGPMGNPDAIGAVVTVSFADGTRVAQEIAAGGGYRSQSSPRPVFVYDQKRAPTSVSVRWPDGHTSGQAVAAGAAEIELSSERR